MNGGRLQATPHSGERFAFGANWARFLKVVDEDRIREAELSLREMLETDLAGKSFLDIGSGSGLFSLAARRLGARVHSFDDDPASVACTAELRRRFFPDDPGWTIECGSVLDDRYIESLGPFEVVYSWGVLHHTGDLWKALANAATPVATAGRLFVAIYNDQGWLSHVWRFIKRTYNWLPGILRGPFAFAILLPWEITRLCYRVGTLQVRGYVNSWIRYHRGRGMSRWHDMVDWIGGYPFEVATPGRILDFYRSRGFVVLHVNTCGRRHGCNEFVFQRTSRRSAGTLA